MPPRDEQDFERRRQQILDGALQVFANKGFETATTKDIAAASGVGSPGLIYHYFKDKADVLRQLLEQRVPLLDLISHPDQFMALPPREALTLFAMGFMRMIENRQTVALMKLILGESMRRSHVAAMVSAIGPGRGFAFLEQYLERQMEWGVLRRMDAGAAVRCFIGPIVAFLIMREVFPMPDARTLAAETMAESAVEVFLHGMEPVARRTEDSAADSSGAKGRPSPA
jgi:AcrR family transcriptional regulator